MKILGEDNFDKKLIEIIRSYNSNRNSPILLVFDGQEQMGDKIVIDPLLTVRYSPRDGYYNSADDLIVEIVEKNLNREKQEITVITDDIELKKRIIKIQEQFGGHIHLEQATRFVEKLKRLDAQIDDREDGERGLSESEQKDINEDYMKRMVDFLLEIDLDLAEFTILTPFPHTPFRAEMERQGRILHNDWSKYTCGEVAFRPKKMSISSLKKMYEYAWKTFYSDCCQEIKMAKLFMDVIKKEKKDGTFKRLTLTSDRRK